MLDLYSCIVENRKQTACGNDGGRGFYMQFNILNVPFSIADFRVLKYTAASTIKKLLLFLQCVTNWMKSVSIFKSKIYYYYY